ncbi:MAG: hypothetical protein A2X23_09855 [Chloroflexi bacterium GWC2_73_18]|nr:MAG: hypothetical protein A2X23_09855 [Chloroflexi bacterium GWC2_73_18]
MSAEPVQLACFYRVRWGSQEEFVELFTRNHLPLLRAQQETGRILDVRAWAPRFHGDGRADWTLLVIITYRDWAALQERETQRELERRLFPDQERYRAEERRRFELLDAHWDVPLSPAPLAPAPVGAGPAS